MPSGSCFMIEEILSRTSCAATSRFFSSVKLIMTTETFSAEWPDAPHRVLRSCAEAAEALGTDIAGEITRGESTVPVRRFASQPPNRATSGEVRAMALYAGQSVGAVRGVQPAGEIVAELMEGAEQLLRAWS